MNTNPNEFIDDHAMCADGSITIIKQPNQGEDVCHHLWSTPVVTARPFSDEFVKELTEEVQYLLQPGAPGTFNSTNLWDLPNLPPKMLEVKEKMIELMEKHYRPLAEMPLPAFKASKGYFRYSYEGGVYRITPHKHGNTIGVGIFYLKTDNRNPGNLVMIDPRGGVNWTNQFTTFKKIRVEPGLMLIHPGYLIHFVEPSHPDMGMHYGDRLAIITNIHRNHEDFIEVLRKHDNYIGKVASGDGEA